MKGVFLFDITLIYLYIYIKSKQHETTEKKGID